MDFPICRPAPDARNAACCSISERRAAPCRKGTIHGDDGSRSHRVVRCARVIKLEPLPVAEPGENELLLRVCAASVNPVDYKIREGKYLAMKSDKLPYVLGRDVCGTVETCGPGMADWRPGDEIYAMLGLNRGAYAEHVIVKANEAALKPTSLDPAAAAVPLAGLTVWQGLFRHGRLQTGQRTLIRGGSGGVGHFAIQLAKARGAQVITTVSEQHVAFARELGADQVIDYRKQRFKQFVREVDMVFDLIAGETQDRSWRVLRKDPGVDAGRAVAGESARVRRPGDARHRRGERRRPARDRRLDRRRQGQAQGQQNLRVAGGGCGGGIRRAGPHGRQGRPQGCGVAHA